MHTIRPTYIETTLISCIRFLKLFRTLSFDTLLPVDEMSLQSRSITFIVRHKILSFIFQRVVNIRYWLSVALVACELASANILHSLFLGNDTTALKWPSLLLETDSIIIHCVLPDSRLLIIRYAMDSGKWCFCELFKSPFLKNFEWDSGKNKLLRFFSGI